MAVLDPFGTKDPNKSQDRMTFDAPIWTGRSSRSSPSAPAAPSGPRSVPTTSISVPTNPWGGAVPYTADLLGRGAFEPDDMLRPPLASTLLRPGSPVAAALVAPPPAVPRRTIFDRVFKRFAPAAAPKASTPMSPLAAILSMSPANFNPTSGGSKYAVTTTKGGGTGGTPAANARNVTKTYQTPNGTMTSYDSSYTGPAGTKTANADDYTGDFSSYGESKVLCTWFMRKGWLPRDLWLADGVHASRLPLRTRALYWRWGVPALRRIEAGNWLLEWAMWPIAKHYSRYAAWKVGIIRRRPLIGTAVNHICTSRRFSRFMRWLVASRTAAA